MGNAGRIAVNSGNACTSNASRGGHYYATTVPNPWEKIGYGSTSSAASTDFIFSVTTSLLEIANKPFLMRSTTGAVVACGLIGANTTTTSTTSTTEAPTPAPTSSPIPTATPAGGYATTSRSTSTASIEMVGLSILFRLGTAAMQW